MIVALADAGFQVTTATQNTPGFEYLRRESLEDLVVMLDDSRRGRELCSWIRCVSNAPIVALCRREDEASRTRMFELGADACMSVRGSSSELVARVRALLWRYGRTYPLRLAALDERGGEYLPRCPSE